MLTGHNLPASLHVRTLSYSCLISSSRSLSMRSQTRLTCLNVKSGASFFDGLKALKNEGVEVEACGCNSPCK